MEEKLLDEMNELLSVSSEPDEDDLPFEPFDAFSTDPVEFVEMSERMLVKVENIFDLTRIYNRHSPKYLKAFAMLERGIRQLGSVCVTRSALKVQNCPLPELGQLTTKKLYGMASFNYRKLDAALSEKLKISNDLYPELTDAFFRCFTLLRRLRATERKIYTYYDRQYFGKKDFKPAVEGFAFSDKSWTKSYYPRDEEVPAFRDAPAYPVMSAGADKIRNKKSEIRNETDFRSVRKPEAGKFGIQNSEFRNADDSQSVRKPEADEIRNQESGSGIQDSEKVIRNPENGKFGIQNAEPAAAPQTGPAEPNALPGPAEKAPVIEEKTEQAGAPVKKTNSRSGTEVENKKPDLPYGVGGPTPGEDTPPCTEIVRRAVMRGPATENGGIAFKNSEVLALADDPLLEEFFPDMAPWVKQVAVKIRGQSRQT